MSKSVEKRIRLQDSHAAQWIDLLEPRQVRALAHQYGVDNAMTAQIGTLRTSLLLLPEVRELAGESDGEEVQTKL